VLWVRRARRSPPHFAARSDLLTFFLACTSDQRRARRLECDGPLYRAGSLQVRCVHLPPFPDPCADLFAFVGASDAALQRRSRVGRARLPQGVVGASLAPA
jgi:hypothetical protein